MSKHSPLTAWFLGLVITCAPIACAIVSTNASADGMDDAYASGEPYSADSRVKLLRYNDNDIYTITTRYGYQSSVVFGATEEIQTISVGDRSLWQFIPAGHRLFIRPMDSGVTTNMTVITNKHAYLFDIKSIASDSTGSKSDKAGKKHPNADNTNDSVIYVAKFAYPEDEKKAPTPGVTPLTVGQNSFYAPPLHASPSPDFSQASSQPLSATGNNYNYTFSGPDELAPLQVYDDGHSTFIKYQNPNQPLPNIYIIDRSGNEHLATHYAKDHVMVVDAVSGEMALKNSDGTVHIYNETLNPR